MAMYICDCCDQLKDDDYFPMVESKSEKYVWLCEDCAAEIEEEESDESN